MKTGDILLIPFPFAEHTGEKKIRPCILACKTADSHQDLVVCAISSVIPTTLSPNEILLAPSQINNLRRISVLKVDRIVTIKAKNVIATLGELDKNDIDLFRAKFKALV